VCDVGFIGTTVSHKEAYWKQTEASPYTSSLGNASGPTTVTMNEGALIAIRTFVRYNRLQ
jgi:hypothetical protein